jgi:hypothetical protein
MMLQFDSMPDQYPAATLVPVTAERNIGQLDSKLELGKLGGRGQELTADVCRHRNDVYTTQTNDAGQANTKGAMISDGSLRILMLRHVQGTQRHDASQDNLLLFGQLELVYDGHRKDQQRKIRGDVETRIGKPQPELIHTTTFDFGIPKVGRWGAQEDGRKRDPNTVEDDEAQHDRTNHSLGPEDSDTQILNRY